MQTQQERKVQFRMTASTTKDQVVAIPGNPLKSWKNKDRSFFTFASENPIRFRFGVASARYRSYYTHSNSSTIHLLYHPQHTRNIPLMAEAARTSMNWLEKYYGTYPHKSLTIVEIPSYHADDILATSYPGVIYFRENGGFTANFSSLDHNDINYLYRRTAHEVAHQWWGDKFNPDRSAPGASFLTESLAEYSAALIIKSVYGSKAYKELMNYEIDQYRKYRNRIGEETSLLQVTGSNDYIAYFKGPLVLDAVSQLIGENNLLELLRKIIIIAGDGATAQEFYEYLHLKIPEYHSLHLKKWFEETGIEHILDFRKK